MATPVAFKLITPLAVAFEGEAELVIAVGTEGETGIYANHAPYLTALKPGLLRATVVENGAMRRLELACGEGFLQALPDKITVLVDAALSRDDIDANAARADRDAAIDRQKSAGGDLTVYQREQAAIDFANAKLRLLGQL